MQLIANGLNGNYLMERLWQYAGQIEQVEAVVAYSDSTQELFKYCWDNSIKLTFWGRYDHTVPVSVSILEEFLKRKSANYVCRLVPDILHSKVIRFHGAGAYIGSANATHRGWWTNIEAGIFLTEDELVDTGMDHELTLFFREVNSRSYALSNEIVKELSDQNNRNKPKESLDGSLRASFEKNRKIPKLSGLSSVTRSSSEEKQRNLFLKDWNETLTTLRNIADKVSHEKYRPVWVRPEVPRGAQADQFLHAYYYNKVKISNKSLHESFYEASKSNPEKALEEAMVWWSRLGVAPSFEDEMLNESAVLLEDLLSKDRLLHLSREQFIDCFSRVHAVSDYSRRVRYSVLGLTSPLPSMNSQERVNYFSEWMWRQQSSGGKNILDVLNFVLYGGGGDKTAERIWAAEMNPEWAITGVGRSTLSEMVGWALPNQFPPRNGRTSKALKALGFDVEIWSA